MWPPASASGPSRICAIPIQISGDAYFPFSGSTSTVMTSAAQANNARLVVLAGAGATLVQHFDHLDGIEGGRFALGDPLAELLDRLLLDLVQFENPHHLEILSCFLSPARYAWWKEN
jgi:hypothetical protein